MSKTEELVSEWVAAKKAKDDADRAHSHAATHLSNACNQLGKRLMVFPKSLEEDPKELHVWVPVDKTREQLMHVTKGRLGGHDYDIKLMGDLRER